MRIKIVQKVTLRVNLVSLFLHYIPTYHVPITSLTTTRYDSYKKEILYIKQQIKVNCLFTFKLI